jgi:ribose transport system permease protein
MTSPTGPDVQQDAVQPDSAGPRSADPNLGNLAHPSDAVVANAERRRLGHTVISVGERYALLGLLALVCVFFSVLPSTRDSFPTLLNARQLLSNQSVLVVLAIAEVFPLILGSFDLSIGSVSAVGAVACASAMSRFDLPLLAAILIGIAFGLFAGTVNGLFVARMHLNSIIVTLGTATIWGGLITWYTSGNNISTGISETATKFGTQLWLGVPSIIYPVIVLAVVAWYVLSQTPLGRYAHAVGANPRAARLVGINVDRQMIIGFVIAGGVAGLSGVLSVAANSGAITSEGPGLLFSALTGVFLSATVFTVGRYNVLGAIVGVMFVAVSISGFTLSGAQSWVNDVFNGAALVVAIAVSSLLTRARRSGSA